MPIPQLKKKKVATPEHVRDASSVRKKRAQQRKGKEPKSAASKSRTKSSTKKSGSGKKKTTKKKAAPKGFKAKLFFLFSRKQIAKTFLFFALACVGACLIVITSAYIWVSKDLADITDIENRILSQATKIYASDGETVLYEVGDNHREDVELDQIAEQVHWATIALEDQNFYKHSGFQLKPFIRAVFRKLTGKSLSATSTLTQQLIKNAILTPERTYTRKLKELILAVRLEQKYDKDEILNMYFNEVYYGDNLQGVQAASKIYFEKNASEVSLAEAATLASLPKSPSALPDDPERLKIRRDYALDQMVELEFITEEEAEQAKQEEISMRPEQIFEISAPHFVMHVIGYLEEKYGHTALRKGGYTVVTTLDWDKQQKAEQAVTDGIAKVEQYGGSNAALVSIDTHSGHVQAMVGSRDWFDADRDGQVNVATSLRQPGSSFKPIVYATAFDKGYTPETRLFDVETDFLTEAEGKYHPRNYDLGARGPISLRYALSQSLNIPAVKLLYLVGVDSALNSAEQLGYTSLKDRSRFGLSLVLGGAEVTLLEHTAAFATFAREGTYHKPVTVLRMQDQTGELLEEWVDNPLQTIGAEATRTLNSVLSDSGARGYTFAGLNLADRAVAAKTGTTNDYRDAWTIGYTPSLATGVWTGNNDNTEMKRGAAGLIIAAPIWKAYMDAVLTGTPVEDFNAPSYKAATQVLGGGLETTVQKSVDTITKEVIPDECLPSYPDEYEEAKEFKEAHTILYYLNKDDPAGAAPSNPRDDIMFEPWETAVVQWTKGDERKNEYFSDETPTVDCSMRDKGQLPAVSISSLKDGETYSKKSLSLGASVTPGTNRTITSVEFIIDVIAVDNKTGQQITSTSTVSSSYSPTNLTNGGHTATVRVTDDKGNTAEDSVSFTYQAKKSN